MYDEVRKMDKQDVKEIRNLDNKLEFVDSLNDDFV
jgi:hypothetical protein